MFIFQQADSSYAVALDNTHAKVIMVDLKTGKYFQSVPSLKDILKCTYSRSLQNERHIVPANAKEYGGRRWSSLKFAVAKELNMDKTEMYSIINNYLVEGKFDYLPEER